MNHATWFKPDVRVCHECGNSSVVEHHLAKVGVASSSLVFRSNHNKPTKQNFIEVHINFL